MIGSIIWASVVTALLLVFGICWFTAERALLTAQGGRVLFRPWWSGVVISLFGILAASPSWYNVYFTSGSAGDEPADHYIPWLTLSVAGLVFYFALTVWRLGAVSRVKKAPEPLVDEIPVPWRRRSTWPSQPAPEKKPGAEETSESDPPSS